MKRLSRDEALAVIDEVEAITRRPAHRGRFKSVFWKHLDVLRGCLDDDGSLVDDLEPYEIATVEALLIPHHEADLPDEILDRLFALWCSFFPENARRCRPDPRDVG